MNRIFTLFAIGALVAVVAARLMRRSSAPTHTEEPRFRELAHAHLEALTGAHAEPALLHD